MKSNPGQNVWVVVSYFRFVSLPCFVWSSLSQFRLVSCYHFIISTFRCVSFLLHFIVPLAISSCHPPVSSFPCFNSSLLSLFRHFTVSFRRFLSLFRFAVLTALDWEWVKVQFTRMLHEVIILIPAVAVALAKMFEVKDILKDCVQKIEQIFDDSSR